MPTDFDRAFLRSMRIADPSCAECAAVKREAARSRRAFLMASAMATVGWVVAIWFVWWQLTNS